MKWLFFKFFNRPPRKINPHPKSLSKGEGLCSLLLWRRVGDVEQIKYFPKRSINAKEFIFAFYSLSIQAKELPIEVELFILEV